MKYILISILLLTVILTEGQESPASKKYILNLEPQNWNIRFEGYYFSEIADERPNKSTAGKALLKGKITEAEFKNSVSEDLLTLIRSSAIQDTGSIPLLLSAEKFQVNETGTTLNHKATLDFAMKIYRVIDGKRYLLYEASGKPEMTMRGPYEGAHEKNIYNALEKFLRSFNDWAKQNVNNPIFVREVKVNLPEEINFNVSNDTIPWNKNYKLKWEDFKGKPSSSPFMAQSNCVFSYKAEPIVSNGILMLNIKLTACFEKSASWVKNGRESTALLAHEQLHFDICELSIRKLKKRFKEFSFHIMNYPDQIKLLFDNAWEEYMLVQEKYDEETKHGIVTDVQASWEKRITDELQIE